MKISLILAILLLTVACDSVERTPPGTKPEIYKCMVVSETATFRLYECSTRVLGERCYVAEPRTIAANAQLGISCR